MPVVETSTSLVRRERWLANRFWLVLPLLLLNAAVTPLLPAGYGTFSQEIPAALAAAESLLRMLVAAVPLLMPLTLRGQRPVWGLYATGVLVYAAAWAAVIAAPDSRWSTSLAGFTAPAWSSILWLAGVGAHSSLRFVPWYRPWMYLAAAGLFAGVHTTHAVLVWVRLQG
ncbi:hypothetical protein NNX28_01380 [Arthrobacter sp. zg-Y859]|uniref:Uncharacterized protein n=1 Tax=Arthrobacter jinronghuae TaxID=2964609 RepID=A0ABT1NLI1_9MICC|nr:hypothetical protein [Arthrobacter jinronghuae]MCQ1948578.1 hypothetical protein [Arthrobacter jinronghuae]UWX78606.1 hypothetical protein N2K98_16885 [Arthrobacter jinronghuae]